MPNFLRIKKMYNFKIITSFFSPYLRHLGAMYIYLIVIYFFIFLGILYLSMTALWKCHVPLTNLARAASGHYTQSQERLKTFYLNMGRFPLKCPLFWNRLKIKKRFFSGLSCHLVRLYLIQGSPAGLGPQINDPKWLGSKEYFEIVFTAAVSDA